ncbi:FecR family protein [Spirosoma utsteinense]|uniref:FecR family protein n=1 Tax=Spirosoma utsteinense TaxID=2585773 RepID=UPI001647BBEC|nr:FecR domain-containing protein [Spirosoma utsteinense]MBC3787806.1 ferric-dicitrate binding protein FerR (iron transport regulator) [Spirosoma utsteinense]
MNQVSKALLLDYHAGRVSALQRKLIEDWLQDARNRSTYYETLIEWETTHPQYVADVTTGLDRFRRRLTGAQSATTTLILGEDVLVKPLLNRFRASWLAAACVSILLLGGWLFRTSILYKTYSTRSGQLQRLVLPDGSRVVLNGNTELRLSRFGWMGDRSQRDVFLTGEAEFSVMHLTDHRPFVVHTDRQLNIEVLGTEFVVLARQRATRVVLIRGIVKLHYQPGQQSEKTLTMRPGQKVTLDPEQRALVLTNSSYPNEFSAWKNRQYIFHDTPLTEIGQMIQDDFGLRVTIKEPSLAERQISGTYNVTHVDELLSALEELLSIRITRQRDRIIFSQLNK